MIVGYTLNEGEIRIAIAEYLSKRGSPVSPRSVKFTASANFTIMDQPTGGHTISATAESNS